MSHLITFLILLCRRSERSTSCQYINIAPSLPVTPLSVIEIKTMRLRRFCLGAISASLAAMWTTLLYGVYMPRCCASRRWKQRKAVPGPSLEEGIPSPFSDRGQNPAAQLESISTPCLVPGGAMTSMDGAGHMQDSAFTRIPFLT
jgi:hypothetical protein